MSEFKIGLIDGGEVNFNQSFPQFDKNKKYIYKEIY